MGVISEAAENARATSSADDENAGQSSADPFLNQFDTGKFDIDAEGVANGLSVLASLTHIL